MALPSDPPGNLELVDGAPEGGKIPELDGNYGAFAPDYAPEEIFEIASKLYELQERPLTSIRPATAFRCTGLLSRATIKLSLSYHPRRPCSASQTGSRERCGRTTYGVHRPRSFTGPRSDR